MPTLDALMNWSIISQTESSTNKIPQSVILKTPQYIRRTFDDSFGLSEDVQSKKIVGCILTALMYPRETKAHSVRCSSCAQKKKKKPHLVILIATTQRNTSIICCVYAQELQFRQLPKPSPRIKVPSQYSFLLKSYSRFILLFKN